MPLYLISLLVLVVFWWSLWGYLYMISSYAQIVTVLLFSNLGAFYYFSCLIAMDKSCNTMLSERRKSEHPCLVPSLRGKAISLLPLCMMLAALPWWLSGKEPTCQSSRWEFTPELERSPGEGNGNPLQYSCLGNPMDRRSLAGYSPLLFSHKVELDSLWPMDYSPHGVHWALLFCKELDTSCSLYTYFVQSFYCKQMLNFTKFFFSIYWDNHMIIILSFVNEMCHVDWFTDIKKIPASLVWMQLVIGHHPFNTLLNLVCHILVEDFYISVHQDYWLVISLFVVSVWSWYWGNATLIKWVWKWFFLFSFLEQLENYRY